MGVFIRSHFPLACHLPGFASSSEASGQSCVISGGGEHRPTSPNLEVFLFCSRHRLGYLPSKASLPHFLSIEPPQEVPSSQGFDCTCPLPSHSGGARLAPDPREPIRCLSHCFRNKAKGFGLSWPFPETDVKTVGWWCLPPLRERSAEQPSVEGDGE